MGEENLCRLCYNLLNDIDYHLKEAQEKTDEITAKYLDKEKDQQRYSREMVEKSPGKKMKEKHERRPRSPSHVPVRGGGKGQSFFKSPERKTDERGKSPKKKHSPHKSVDDSDDEVSEKKRKLLSRVLAPSSKKSRHPSSGLDDEERKLTIDEEVELMRRKRKKEKKMKKREKKKRMLEEINRNEESDHDNVHNDYIQYISDDEDPPGNTSQYSPSKSKSEDIRTVDLSQLGDINWDYQSTSSHVFAKKSIPTSEQQQQLQQQQMMQHQQHIEQQQPVTTQSHQQQQPVFLLPESYTLQPGQDIPIIDCRLVH